MNFQIDTTALKLQAAKWAGFSDRRFYAAMATAAAALPATPTATFYSQWLEGYVTCEYEWEDEQRYQFGALSAGPELTEIIIGGIRIGMHLEAVAWEHIADELSAHLRGNK